MANMSVYLIYEGPTGIPVTIARLTDPGIVHQVAQLAYQERPPGSAGEAVEV